MKINVDTIRKRAFFKDAVIAKGFLELLFHANEKGEVVAFESDMKKLFDCRTYHELWRIWHELQALHEIEFQDVFPVRYPCGRLKDCLCMMKIVHYKQYVA